MIAITFALPTESSGIVAKLEQKRVQSIQNCRLTTGSIHDHEVAVFHTGVGRKVARGSIEALLSAIQPRVLISSGFAGSAVEGLNVGDVILASNYSEPTLLHRLMEGGAPATPQQFGKRPGSQELAPPSAPRIRAVKIYTAESMIDGAHRRGRIAQQHGADAIDMETGEIAQICGAHSIAMLSLRVISDSPAAPFPAPPDVLFDLASQKTHVGRLLPYLLRHPSAVPRLAAFAGRISRVRKILTGALLEVIARV